MEREVTNLPVLCLRNRHPDSCLTLHGYFMRIFEDESKDALYRYKKRLRNSKEFIHH